MLAMGPSKIRRALGVVKDQTSIGLAKVGSSASLSDLDVAIVKATRHEESPAEEKHIREILSLTCYSRAFISACVSTLAKRLNKTKNWTVALKTLILVHRLLNDGDPAYEQEIFFSTRRGTRFLNMSDFRDNSSSSSWDYSAFVRTYALYLDERLEYRMQSRRGRRSAFGFDDDDDETTIGQNHLVSRVTPVREMKTEQVFSRTLHLQQLLERFLACRPTGSAKTNRVVIVALYPSVKESFQIYYDLTETIGILVDRFMEMEIPSCVKVYDMFCRIGKQFDELDNFYSWCKTIGIARSSEYPEVEKITPKKLEVMDEFIRDKSALARTLRLKAEEENKINDAKEADHSVEEVEDMNAIKALPAPEDIVSETGIEDEKKKQSDQPQQVESKPPQQQEDDLLNLGENALSSEDQGEKLALALFDCNPATEATTGPTPPPVWEAFSDGAADWETALVQSASDLSPQKTSLAGGFDMMLLDGMYKQGAASAAMAGPGFGASGSASSVALWSAGQPAMLALPAPPTESSNGSGAAVSTTSNIDPFAASLAVAPPPYVQMSEMEKKQKLMVEEQLMWQQYARDGMQGQLGIGKLQQNPYNMGGYTRTY